MHNLLPHNQLSEWKHFDQTVTQAQEELELINDYYECLIECDDTQATCKRICRRILDLQY